MIKGKYLSYEDDLTEIKKIRDAVFKDELGLSIEYDEMDDQMAMHVLLENESGYVGAARMKFDGDTFELDMLAVLKEYRRNGYCEFMVRMLLDKVFSANGTEIVTSATKAAVGSLKKIGFVVNGDFTEKNGIEKVDMVLKKGQVKTQCGCHE